MIESGFRNFSGFLPVYKPKGICTEKIIYSFKADLHFILNQHEVLHGIVGVREAGKLSLYSDGLLTLLIGSSTLKRRNFVFSDYRYKAVVKFGIDEETDSTDNRHSTPIDGKIIKAAIKSFEGSIKQRINRQNYAKQETNHNSITPLSSIDYYNSIHVPREGKQKYQKYPCIGRERDVTSYSILLKEYIEPIATFDISCQGSFDPITFVDDLANLLKTETSLVELTRLQEGPLSINDLRVLHLHELTIDHYLPYLQSYKEVYNSYLSKYDDRFSEKARNFEV